jgi:hypothetical protein
MKIIQHIVHQPFVFSTGLAALVHSTWSLGTLFAGNEPYPQFTPTWFAWVIPAFLIAFAMDVGQVVTSAEIRAGNRTKTKYLTFAVFAAATYYLQWLYIAHHMPALALADGVRADSIAVVAGIRDAAIWIIPALLPLSTLLYTFSGSEPVVEPVVQPPAVVPVQVMEQRPAQLALALPDDFQVESIIMECPACGWTKHYEDADKARRGLATHQALHCTATHPQQPIPNGAKAE